MEKDLIVWLDDIRPMPPEYNTWVTTAQQAIDLIKTGRVKKISLDHDLGNEEIVGSGYHVAKFIEEGAYRGTVERLVWFIHSQNVVGRGNMRQAMLQANLFWNKHEQKKLDQK